MEAVNEVIVFNEDYWDCECKTDYIRPKQSIGADPTKFKCDRCGAREDQQPDSRADEVVRALAEFERWPSIETRHHYQFDGWVEMCTKIDVLARSNSEAREIAERVFNHRVSDIYNASITNDWCSLNRGELTASGFFDYDGGVTCYTLESTAELESTEEES